jgi:hypothetical protein
MTTARPALGFPTLVRFGLSLFAGAALLFCVEPMVAKMLMPLLGGAPAVWITCMLFFQSALLLSYAYAHASTAWLGVRVQAATHVVVLLLPLLVLPIHLGPAEIARLGHGASPVLGLLVVLTAVVGLPFFVVGTTAPLIQKWFSQIGHPAGSDPYFLYGASNLGSLVGLASYPVLIEPWIGLRLQSALWRWGYVGLVALVASCALTTVLRARTPEAVPDAENIGRDAVGASGPLTWGRRARWVVLAFVPSSFLLGVTAYITTDLAGIPLFWVLPLGLYLASFTLVFARRPPLSHALVVRILPFGLTATVMMLVMQASTPILLIVTVHLLTLFLASMACHGELAKDRPSATHLTEFFLWVSVGGVLGGVANGLVAPAIFDRIVEYPLAMVLAAYFGRVPAKGSEPSRLDWGFLALTGVLTLGLVLFGKAMHFSSAGPLTALMFAPPLFLTYSQLARPRRFALGLVGVLVGGNVYTGVTGTTLVAERNFFGVVRVLRDPTGEFVQIVHGNTIHGRQRLDPAHRNEPSGYYTRIGPLTQVFDQLHALRAGESEAIGVVGLGAGSMAPYALPRDTWTYYEINPAVVAMAENPAYFTYLKDAFGESSRLKMVVGDARLRLEEVPDGTYDLLAIDAFSSDAIPAHLLTREAFALYERKLSAHGLLVLHISNRYLNLAPVLANLATDAGLTGFLRRDTEAKDPTAASIGWTPSEWAVLAKRGDPSAVLAADARWERFPVRARPPWTDDFSDLISAYRWE